MTKTRRAGFSKKRRRGGRKTTRRRGGKRRKSKRKSRRKKRKTRRLRRKQRGGKISPLNLNKQIKKEEERSQQAEKDPNEEVVIDDTPMETEGVVVHCQDFDEEDCWAFNFLGCGWDGASESCKKEHETSVPFIQVF